jgi:DNA-binding MarR family transcriptional regulator
MEKPAERDLEILTAIGEGEPLTQRDLSRRLGVALGLTNLCLKRLARKGYVKIVDFPRRPAARKRLRYLLTPQGLAEKSRLTYEHIAYSLNLYRRARQTLREALAPLPAHGMKRVALYGVGEAAELAYLTLCELRLELVGIFADGQGGGHFLGLPVRPVAELADTECDRIVVATFDRASGPPAALVRLGLPADKFVTLRRGPAIEEATGTLRRA